MSNPNIPTHPGAIPVATGELSAIAQANGPSIEPAFMPTIEYLVEVVQSLSLAKTIAAIMAIVRVAARQLTGADGASFVLRDGDHCFYADEDAIGPLWKGQRFPLNTCVSGWVMNTHEAISIPDIFADNRVPIEAYRATFVRSMAMVPIRAHDPIGAIGSYWARPHEPSPLQIRILQALADSTAVSLENIRVRDELEDRVRGRTEELEAVNEELRAEAILRKQMESKVLRLSLTDDLTGLSNRRGFLMRAEQLIKLVHRMQTFAWMLFIDLDGLKQVNDQHGHEAGSQLIRNAAQVLRETFRESDVIGRIGGDEFMVFALGSSTSGTDQGSEIDKRLKRRIEHQNHCFPDRPQLSMSVGVVRYEQSLQLTLDEMIQLADAAMYVEKRRKRALQSSSQSD